MINPKSIRKQFHIYDKRPELVYLDTAASALKVSDAVDAVDFYHNELGVNVHRGAYELAYEATRLYEEARESVADFIHADAEEVIFTKGTTQALNLVAHGFYDRLNDQDEIIVSELEHNSSLLPWMMVSKKTGAKLVYVPLNKEGRITVSAFKSVLSNKTKVVALTLLSNVLGYRTPVEEIIKLAHQVNAIVILDGAQGVVHQKVDVKALDCDFLAFSGHKMFGPSGVGVLFGKTHLLNQLEPYEYGGEMVDQVFLDHATWKSAPLRFEAGTPVIGGAIGLKKAVDFIKSQGIEDMHQYNMAIRNEAVLKLKQIDGIKIFNEQADAPIITFNIDDVHPHDIATFLDQYHVSVRAGQHCAPLISKFLNQPATIRASFSIYNTKEDVETFVKSVMKARDFFRSF